MSSVGLRATARWYHGLSPAQWRVLVASNLGWLLDGYEAYALILTAGAALKQLLAPGQMNELPVYAGLMIAVTVFGWGAGGILGGILADYIGRKRTMLLAILAYSLTAGLSAFAWSWESFAVLRLVVGLAIGSEWVTGASLTAEIWPDKDRGKGGGLMQCGVGIGFFLASLIWLFVSDHGPDAWRVMYLIGVLPGLLTLWIRASVPESERWSAMNERRRAAASRKRQGLALDARDRHLTRFTLVDLFRTPELRRRMVIALLMSFTTTLAWWGTSSWVPPYIGSVATAAGLPGPRWASLAGMAYNFGAILGYLALGFMADRIGRKPTTMIFFASAFVLTPVLFLWTRDLGLLLVAAGANGFFTLGQYAWMAIWLPELFPTSSRGTATAFCFNAPRLVAAIGPIVAGTLILKSGGFGNAAMIVSSIYVLGFVCAPFLPETRGRSLAQDGPEA